MSADLREYAIQLESLSVDIGRVANLNGILLDGVFAPIGGVSDYCAPYEAVAVAAFDMARTAEKRVKALSDTLYGEADRKEKNDEEPIPSIV